jgi:NitT/TauT family transport system substrate-binding protein
MKTSRVIAGSAALVALSLVLAACGSDAGSTKAGLTGAIPSKPERGTFVLATQPWIGYGIFDAIDPAEGIFQRQGLNVKSVSFNTDSDLNAALASGRVDAANVGIIQALHFANAGLPIKIVMLEDQSQTADGILAGPGITSLKQLKGKSVASEVGTVTDIELSYALSTVGLSDKDIHKVNIPAADSGAAVIAGKVAAAVTYEPNITEGKLHGLHLIWHAGEKPGLVGDALVVRQAVMNSRPGQVEALIKAWQQGLDYYDQHTSAARAIISRHLGVSSSSLAPSFNGITFYTVPQSKTQIDGAYANTLGLVYQNAQKAGILQGTFNPSTVLAPRFVDAYHGG